MPTVENAMKKMVNDLSTVKRTGCRAVVIVHGYGSTGQGGAIKTAAGAKLKDPSLRGIVRASVAGENWQSRKREFTDICPQLRDFSRYVDGNKGITVVLLR